MATGKDLTALVQRRDRLRESVQRVQGRLDSARQDFAAVEEECRKKKVDPDQIDTVIARLEQRLEAEVANLTAQLGQAETQLMPYLEG